MCKPSWFLRWEIQIWISLSFCYSLDVICIYKPTMYKSAYKWEYYAAKIQPDTLVLTLSRIDSLVAPPEPCIVSWLNLSLSLVHISSLQFLWAPLEFYLLLQPFFLPYSILNLKLHNARRRRFSCGIWSLGSCKLIFFKLLFLQFGVF